MGTQPKPARGSLGRPFRSGLRGGVGHARPGRDGGGVGRKSPIVIGYISDLTGVASPNFADGPGGAQARIDLQKAKGGIDGRALKLVVEDDQSSPATNVTAAQDLVENKGALLVIDNSVFTFSSAKYLQQ